MKQHNVAQRIRETSGDRAFFECTLGLCLELRTETESLTRFKLYASTDRTTRNALLGPVTRALYDTTERLNKCT